MSMFSQRLVAITAALSLALTVSVGAQAKPSGFSHSSHSSSHTSHFSHSSDPTPAAKPASSGFSHKSTDTATPPTTAAPVNRTSTNFAPVGKGANGLSSNLAAARANNNATSNFNRPDVTHEGATAAGAATTAGGPGLANHVGGGGVPIGGGYGGVASPGYAPGGYAQPPVVINHYGNSGGGFGSFFWGMLLGHSLSHDTVIASPAPTYPQQNGSGVVTYTHGDTSGYNSTSGIGPVGPAVGAGAAGYSGPYASAPVGYASDSKSIPGTAMPMSTNTPSGHGGTFLIILLVLLLVGLGAWGLIRTMNGGSKAKPGPNYRL